MSDEGPGILNEEREKLLQPLYQSAYPRQGKGHELGLSMVRAVCNLNNANLSNYDSPNRRSYVSQ